MVQGFFICTNLGLLCDQNVTNMPRYKEPFTIFPRKLSSGKTVYYYRTYTPDGSRTVAHSTGKSTKSQAKQFCSELLVKGQLLSTFGTTFGEYAKDFFSDTSQWMLDKIQISQGKEQPVAKNTLKSYRHCNEAFLIPFFKNVRLMEIKPLHIKQFRSRMIEQGFSNSAINLSCACLKIIISYAIADKLIINNPFVSVQQMYVNAKTKDSYTLKELLITFNSKWLTPERKLFCLIAACTGMRISEISAIRKETVFTDYINVKDQLANKELRPVKDGEKRKVPISPELYKAIQSILQFKSDFLFTENQDTYRQDFYRHTKMKYSERIEKGLSFHSLRHFVNTYFLSKNISELKVKSVLGHSSGKGSMTERYLNFQIENFKEIVEAENELFKQFCGGSYDITLQ